MAIVYPRHLRTTSFANLPDEMSRAALEFTLVIDAGSNPGHLGDVSEIVGALRRIHEVIVRDDVLQQAVDLLSVGIGEVANAVLSSRGASDRLIGVLGVGDRPDAAAV